MSEQFTFDIDPTQPPAQAPTAAVPPQRRRRRRADAMEAPPLQLTVPKRCARRRPLAESRREDEDLYAAIDALRRAGVRVYRSGTNHKVDGRLLTTAQLLRTHKAILRQARAQRGGEPTP